MAFFKSVLNNTVWKWKDESLTSEEAEAFVKTLKRTHFYPFTKQFVMDRGGLQTPTAQNFVKTLQRSGLYHVIKQVVHPRVEDGSSSSRWCLSCFRGEHARARDSCSGHGVPSSLFDSTRGSSLHDSTRVMISDGGPDPSSRGLLEKILAKESRAQGKAIMEDDGVIVKPTSQTRAAVAPPFMLTVEEKLDVTLDNYCEIRSFDLQGKLSLVILNQNQEDGFGGVQVETGDNPEIRYATHPDFDGKLFLSHRILGFLAGPSCHEDGTLLWWRMQRANKSMVPLTINLWTKDSGNKTRVSITYDSACFFNLKNVIISIPLPPAIRDVMTVTQCSGNDWSYESRNSVLQWKLPLINDSNRGGLIEFLVPPVGSEVFFPISSQFATSNTFSGLKVTRVFPERGGGDDGFVQTNHLITQNYQVV